VFPTPLVDSAWLGAHPGEPDLVVVDGSWYLPAMGRDARAEFRAGHIPGAVFWDIDALSDRHTALPHMLPDAQTLARDIGGLGIGNSDRIVVYDGSGTNLSAPRVWWMLRVAGHDAVAVLDGGIGKWRAEGRPLEAGDSRRPAQPFEVCWHPELVRSLGEVREIAETGSAQLLDARSSGRFAGTEPEPRAGIRSGHIPGARNLPFAELVAQDGTLLPLEELARRFAAAGIDLARPVVTSCGSGVTACALALGLHRLGRRDYAVYDGSWTEWGAPEGPPVERG
jgi:thiosulfate/3-mercaptopyruvate sulfurtransferase